MRLYTRNFPAPPSVGRRATAMLPRRKLHGNGSAIRRREHTHFRRGSLQSGEGGREGFFFYFSPRYTRVRVCLGAKRPLDCRIYEVPDLFYSAPLFLRRGAFFFFSDRQAALTNDIFDSIIFFFFLQACGSSFFSNWDFNVK